MKSFKIFLPFFMLLAFISCSKYEEGPGITLLSKSSRMCQKWRPIQSVDGSTGEITNIDRDGSYIEFIKNGTIQYYNKNQMSFLGIDAVTGTWEFSSDKTQVTITYELAGFSSTDTYTINKLKINSLALIDDSGDKIYYEYY